MLSLFIAWAAAATPGEGALLAGGFGHACVIASGQLYCWGDNHYGQLGIGRTGEPEVRAVLVPGIDDAIGVALGDFHTCVWRASGGLWCFGRNEEGQLGDGTLTSRSTPVRISALERAQDQPAVVEVNLGGYHSCALTATGSVWCWGLGDGGQLGDGSTKTQTQPVTVSGLHDVTAIAAGSSTTCALRATGQVACWGSSAYGALGDGRGGKEQAQSVPLAVPGIEDAVELVNVGFGGCARLRSGHVRCWGWNLRGEVGDGTQEIRPLPVEVLGIDDATALFASGPAVCARRASQQTWCWGGDELSPTPSRAPWFERGEPMSGEGPFSCLRQGGGAVQCQGVNAFGQLGNGTLAHGRAPTLVQGVPTLSRAPAPIGPPFSVSIEQRGESIELVMGPDNIASVTLAPEPFVMVVRLRKDRSALFVGASDDPASLRIAASGARIDTVPVFSSTAIAEALYNPGQVLLLDDEAPSLWYFTSANDHRFDGPCVEAQGQLVCRRTIAHVRPAGPNGDLPLIAPLSLVFADQREEPASGASTVWRQTLLVRFSGR